MQSSQKRLFSFALKRPLLCIVALAAIIRIGYAAVAPTVDPVISKNPLHGDASGYHLLATNLLENRVFSWDGENPTSYRMPGYPAILALMYWLFGLNLAPMRLLQALAGSLLCIPVYWIGRRMGGETLAIASACGIAIHPILIFMTGWIYSETLFITILWMGICALIACMEKPKLALAIAAGCIIGLAAYFRPEVSILAVAVLAFAMLFRWSWSRIGMILVAQVVVALVILPWSVRNSSIHERTVFLTTSSGSNFYAGNNPKSGGGSAWAYPQANMTELQSDVDLGNRARSWILENKWEFVQLLFLKLARFLSPVDMEAGPGFAEGFPALAARSVYTVFLLFVAVGVLKRGKTYAGSVLLAGVAMYVWIALTFFGGTRVALPVAPAFMLFSVAGVMHFWERFRHLRSFPKTEVEGS